MLSNLKTNTTLLDLANNEHCNYFKHNNKWDWIRINVKAHRIISGREADEGFSFIDRVISFLKDHLYILIFLFVLLVFIVNRVDFSYLEQSSSIIAVKYIIKHILLLTFSSILFPVLMFLLYLIILGVFSYLILIFSFLFKGKESSLLSNFSILIVTILLFAFYIFSFNLNELSLYKEIYVQPIIEIGLKIIGVSIFPIFFHEEEIGILVEYMKLGKPELELVKTTMESLKNT